MATQPHNEIIPEIPPSLLPSRPFGAARRKKKLVRRTDRDYSQALRRFYQSAFVLVNVYLGGMFYLWVRHFETGIGTKVVARPAGVEGWLPIAGLMNFKYWLVTGRVPVIHPAAMFLLISFLSISFLFRKAFCSWLCPAGTLSEYLWRAGRKLFRRNLALPRWIDLPLRGLKYLLLGFFLWAVSSMSTDAITAFMRGPYGLIADVKMLNFFRHISETGLIVLGILVVASLFVQNFWCRYLCPYGALLGLTSLFSPLRIRRNPAACIECAKCAKACPSLLPVDKLVSVRSAECTACMECVAVCPAKGALQMSTPTRVRSRVDEARPAPALPAWALAVGIAALFLGIVGYAKTAGMWQTNVPRTVYIELVPQADQASHPMPGDPALNQ
ncbi:MAG TPA: 4Fe-4S binding protein [Terriglobales bacterium]|nr:4Fe-4S binding protein [Terriglobales bacterium]